MLSIYGCHEGTAHSLMCAYLSIYGCHEGTPHSLMCAYLSIYGCHEGTPHSLICAYLSVKTLMANNTAHKAGSNHGTCIDVAAP